MKLLLDANLSWRLCQYLAAQFPGIEHVRNIPISQPATDEAIWQFAKANGYVIVTNDEDFLRLVLQRGFPPKVVLLRLGNQHTNMLRDVLLKHKTDIEALAASDEYGFLEVYEQIP